MTLNCSLDLQVNFCLPITNLRGHEYTILPARIALPSQQNFSQIQKIEPKTLKWDSSPVTTRTNLRRELISHDLDVLWALVGIILLYLERKILKAKIIIELKKL